MFSSYLVFTAENGYKSEFSKLTTICCGFCYDEAITYGGVFVPKIVLPTQDMKNPRFWDRG